MSEPFPLLDHVSERDVDLMIVFLLFSSESFRSNFLKRVIGFNGSHTLIRTTVSEYTDAGETDVLLIVDLDGGHRLAVMIEDKIDAIFQPAQAQRYRKRGSQGIEGNKWHSFKACLCAPKAYLDGINSKDSWDSLIAIEDISDWAEQSGDRNGIFVKRIFEQALGKFALRRNESSPEAKDFWGKYLTLAAELIPSISVTGVSQFPTKAAPWPRFAKSTLPGFILLEHKPAQARVDLTFDRWQKNDLQKILANNVQPVVRAGGSSALRWNVPQIDHLKSFEEQENNVRDILSHVKDALNVTKELAPRALSRLKAIEGNPRASEVILPS